MSIPIASNAPQWIHHLDLYIQHWAKAGEWAKWLTDRLNTIFSDSVYRYDEEQDCILEHEKIWDSSSWKHSHWQIAVNHPAHIIIDRSFDTWETLSYCDEIYRYVEDRGVDISCIDPELFGSVDDIPVGLCINAGDEDDYSEESYP